MWHAGSRLRRAAILRKPRAGQEADGEIGAGTLEVERVEVECVEPARVLPDLLDSGLPGAGRIGLIEAADVLDVVPEPRERFGLVEIRVHHARPARRRIRRERPRDRALVDRPEGLLDRRQAIEPGPGRVDPVEQARRHERHEHDPRGVEVAETEHPLSEPRRHPAEALLCGMLGADPLHPRVEVLDVDIAGAPFVGPPGDRRDERLRLR